MTSTIRVRPIGRNDIADLAAWTDEPITSVYQSIMLGRPAEELEVRLHSAERHVRHLLTERFQMGTVEATRYSERLHDIDVAHLLGTPGVAFFLTPDRAVEVCLDAAPGELVEVGSAPNLLPLVPWFEDRSHWWLLCLSKSHIRLWRGDRMGLTPVHVPDMPQSLKDTVWSVRREPGLNRQSSGVLHGTGGDRDLVKTDLRRHFRAVDEALAPVLMHSHAPLVVAAVEYEASMFGDVTHYRGGPCIPLIGNPEHADERTLHQRSRDALNRAGASGIPDALERLHTAQDKGWVATYPNRVATAYTQGRVAELLIAESLTAVDGIRRFRADAREVAPAVLTAVRARLPVTTVPDRELPKGAMMAALLRY
jgi:hypothetical protein